MVGYRLGVKVRLGFSIINNETQNEIDEKPIEVFECVKNRIADFLNMDPNDFKIDITIERNLPIHSIFETHSNSVIYDIDFYTKFYVTNNDSIRMIKMSEFSAVLKMRESPTACQLEELHIFTEQLFKDLFVSEHNKLDIYNITTYNNIVDI